ncbi:uridine phosphorylase [Elusimicrobium simillimum]|uniref:nucleoside phosphorylase n=1 Tax=Elusimicrobium simillimum TaxID=3143438 RepID=UPI003C6F2DAA
MIYPKDKKYLEAAISGAANYLAHIKADLKLPPNIVMCPVSMLTKVVANNYKNKFYRLDGDIYVLEGYDAAFVTNFGMGAPAFAMMMEVLIGLGCKNFMLIGIAGALQKNLEIGDIVLCEKALRDEGVSSSYVTPGHYSFPSVSLTQKVKDVLRDDKQDYHYGPTWTTDVLFRETAPEVKFYQENGVQTVEMEAAAAFAIAEHHKVNCGAMFAISDTLANLKWEPAFGHKNINDSMQQILKTCLKSFK